MPAATIRLRARCGAKPRRVARGVAGLGKVEPTSTDTLIAYAAKAGSTAEDGDREHSPFTTALLKHLTVPGLDLRLAFGRVGRGDEDDQQAPGAVRVWFARRRQLFAGRRRRPRSRARTTASRPTSRPTTNSSRRSVRARPGRFSSPPTRPASMPISRASSSRNSPEAAECSLGRRRPFRQPSRGPSTRELLDWER